MLSFYALDDIDQIGEFTTLTSARVVERDLRAGEWYIEVPDSAATRAMRAATWPGIEVVDSDTGWRFGGFQTKRGTTVDGDGRQTGYWFAGVDFQGWMQGWRLWPDPLDETQFWIRSIGQGLALTFAVHNAAWFEFGPGALPERKMPHLEGIGVDMPVEGPAPTFWGESQPLLELFRGWMTGQDWTLRLRLRRDSTVGSVLWFSTPARQLADRIFEAETGQVGSVSTEEASALASHAIAMGGEVVGGEVGQRVVSHQRIPVVDWKSRYWEVFRDRPALELAELADETGKWLNELGPTTTVSLGEVEVEGWGRTIDLGWKAQVRLESGEVVMLPVTSSTLTVRPGRTTRTMSIGAESLSAEQAVARQFEILAERVRRLEREGQRT